MALSSACVIANSIMNDFGIFVNSSWQFFTISKHFCQKNLTVFPSPQEISVQRHACPREKRSFSPSKFFGVKGNFSKEIPLRGAGQRPALSSATLTALPWPRSAWRGFRALPPSGAGAPRRSRSRGLPWPP